ncbi:MAG TPA: UbiA family prenyltransferase [Candidatus Methanomethylophilaceae archaeon]|nr:UbiA family prenyltransferase [Candidatus Methanomethylophilaceae archaeon]
MNKYLRLFRFGNGLMGIIGVIVGAFIASGLNITDYWISISISCLIVFIFMAGGNAINDYIDRDIDKIAHPERPVPQGEIKPITAKNLGISMMILSVLIGVLAQVSSFYFDFIFWDFISTIVVLIAALLMVSYELFLKQRGFIGNVTIALMTGMLFLLGGAVCNNAIVVVPIALMAILVNIGREIAKDIEDQASDEGRDTLPMRIGVRGAASVAAVFFIAGVALSVWPLLYGSMSDLYLLVLAADAMFIYAAIIVFKSAHSAQKIAKIAMIIALLAFVIGVI